MVKSRESFISEKFIFNFTAKKICNAYNVIVLWIIAIYSVERPDIAVRNTFTVLIIVADISFLKVSFVFNCLVYFLHIIML